MKFIVDADILVYQAATSVQEDIEWADGVWTSHADLDLAKRKLEDMVDDWITQAEQEWGAPDDVIHVVSDPDTDANYRKKLPHVEYKGNRKGTKRPMIWKVLREWFVKEYQAIWEPTLEGDDLCGLFYEDGDVIISQDKDMLTIPGKHYRPGKGGVTVTPQEAEKFFYSQILTGDRVDGYYGVPRCGPKTAEAWLARKEPVWDIIILAYEKGGLTAEHALANARCARILRGDDYNFDTKEVTLWVPPCR
jgi:DNA polymerase-1